MSDLGTINNPIRILVADNWGKGAHSYLSKAFPNVTFTVYKEAPSDHPHGHMVAECICYMLSSDTYAEIVFLPYLSLQGVTRYDWLNVIESEREAGRPFHVANCSFGAHHNNEDWRKRMLGAQWDTPEEIEVARKKIGDTIVLFASGNQDGSRRGRTDWDNDVNYPQKPLAQLKNLYVIGACDYRGIPSLFSSDGEEVFAMYLGEGVVVFDPLTNRLVKVNGTSFASPFAAGNVAELIINGYTQTEDWYLDYVLDSAWLAEDFERGKQHRKAGYGCMLPIMYSKDYFRNEYLTNSTGILEVKYQDFEELG
jgi:hypothetical protein